MIINNSLHCIQCNLNECKHYKKGYCTKDNVELERVDFMKYECVSSETSSEILNLSNKSPQHNIITEQDHQLPKGDI